MNAPLFVECVGVLIAAGCTLRVAYVAGRDVGRREMLDQQRFEQTWSRVVATISPSLSLPPMEQPHAIAMMERAAQVERGPA